MGDSDAFRNDDTVEGVDDFGMCVGLPFLLVPDGRGREDRGEEEAVHACSVAPCSGCDVREDYTRYRRKMSDAGRGNGGV